MLKKAKLVKKQNLENAQPATEKPAAITETRERIQFTQHFMQTTKDWLVSRHKQQSNARQAFAALFMNSDTRSNAI